MCSLSISYRYMKCSGCSDPPSSSTTMQQASASPPTYKAFSIQRIMFGFVTLTIYPWLPMIICLLQTVGAQWAHYVHDWSHGSHYTNTHQWAPEGGKITKFLPPFMKKCWSALIKCWSCVGPVKATASAWICDCND